MYFVLATSRFLIIDTNKDSNIFKYLKDKYEEESVGLVRKWENSIKKIQLGSKQTTTTISAHAQPQQQQHPRRGTNQPQLPRQQQQTTRQKHLHGHTLHQKIRRKVQKDL